MKSRPLFHPRLKFLVAVFSLMTAWPADADTSRNEEIAERFAAADTNHDGQLTLAEAQAGMPRVAANFSKIDADGSGTVTLAEIEALADR
jgi:Ca2+-binding EF-hand superfamily protein